MGEIAMGDFQQQNGFNFLHRVDSDVERVIAKRRPGSLPKRGEQSLLRAGSAGCFTVNDPARGFCGMCRCELTKEAANKIMQAKTRGNSSRRFRQ